MDGGEVMASKSGYWFPCYVNDLLGSFTWRAMTNEERGAYWQLICLQTQAEDGMLPGNVETLSRMAEIDLKKHPIVLEKFPTMAEGKRANERAFDVWKEKERKSESAVQSIRKRYERSTNVVRTDDECITDEERTKNERSGNVGTTRARVSESESELEKETESPKPPRGGRSVKRIDVHNAAVEAFAKDIAKRGDAFEEAFRSFCGERATRRDWMTAKAVEMTLSKLDVFPVEVCVEALNNSVANGWQGVFPERVAQDQARRTVVSVGSNGVEFRTVWVCDPDMGGCGEKQVKGEDGTLVCPKGCRNQQGRTIPGRTERVRVGTAGNGVPAACGGKE
jgi:hypothetical protein